MSGYQVYCSLVHDIPHNQQSHVPTLSHDLFVVGCSNVWSPLRTLDTGPKVTTTEPGGVGGEGSEEGEDGVKGIAQKEEEGEGSNTKNQQMGCMLESVGAFKEWLRKCIKDMELGAKGQKGRHVVH